MPREYDFEMVRRAYEEIARRALGRDESERPPQDPAATRHPKATFEAPEDITADEAER